jgi:hypothetical protein
LCSCSHSDWKGLVFDIPMAHVHVLRFRAHFFESCIDYILVCLACVSLSCRKRCARDAHVPIDRNSLTCDSPKALSVILSPLSAPSLAYPNYRQLDIQGIVAYPTVTSGNALASTDNQLIHSLAEQHSWLLNSLLIGTKVILLRHARRKTGVYQKSGQRWAPLIGPRSGRLYGY